VRLYAGKEKIFPEFININGETFAINADFRNILRIFAMMKDGNIADMKKILKLRDWFIDSDKIIESSEVIRVFGEFINPETAANQGQNGAYPEVQEKRQFCYEFDSEEIYTSFLSEYKIDLFECEFLHWYKFKMMLENLSEASSFKKKIALRFIDLNDFSRENPRFSEILQAYESVQLPYEYNDEELREMQEFKEFWDRV
jgi:hypothetical protein